MSETTGTQECPEKASAPALKVTSVTLLTLCRAEEAEGLKRALDGQTYMKFRVTICPYMGAFNVNAETDYKASKAEIKDFLLYALAACVAKK